MNGIGFLLTHAHDTFPPLPLGNRTRFSRGWLGPHKTVREEGGWGPRSGHNTYLYSTVYTVNVESKVEESSKTAFS